MSKKTKAEERAARAAAVLAERKRQERRRNILKVIGVIAVMVLIVVVGVLINQSRDDGKDDKVEEVSEYELVIGDDDAEHTIVIYEDYLCPICQALEAGTRDELAKLADEGKVQVSYRPFNLFSSDGDPRKPYSVDAAEVFGVVLEKSGDEVAKKFHDLLFENQPSESGPFPDQDDLVDLAVEAGATESDVTAGLADGDGEDWVNGATDATSELGINSTPTVYLDGEQFQDYRTMEDLVTNLLAAVS